MNIEDKIQQISIHTTATAIPTEIILGLNLYKQYNKRDEEIDRIMTIGYSFCETFKCAKKRLFDREKCDANLFIGFKLIFSNDKEFDDFQTTISDLESALKKIKNIDTIEDETMDRLKQKLNDFSEEASIKLHSVDNNTFGLGLSV